MVGSCPPRPNTFRRPGNWHETCSLGRVIAYDSHWLSRRTTMNVTASLRILNIKLIYSEKATKNWRNLPQGLIGCYLVMSKPWGKLHQIFVAFSENIFHNNFVPFTLSFRKNIKCFKINFNFFSLNIYLKEVISPI